MLKHILVIDDEPCVRDAFTLALSSSTCLKVACAEDGLSGIEAAARQQPDLIFLDLKMPGIDGVETLRRLMAQYPNPAPVYVISAFTYEYMKPLKRALAEGLFFQVIPKPLSAQQIREIVHTVVGH